MVIAPVDAEIDEAQHVAQEYRKHGAQGREVDPMGDLQLQHHDGHNDRQHRIAEYFHSRLAHYSAPAGTTTGAPCFFNSNTTNLAGLVLLAFRPTTWTSSGPS